MQLDRPLLDGRRPLLHLLADCAGHARTATAHPRSGPCTLHAVGLYLVRMWRCEGRPARAPPPRRHQLGTHCHAPAGGQYSNITLRDITVLRPKQSAGVLPALCSP